MTLKAVDPQEWLKTAYYETEWFSGASVQDAFDALAADNNTIILERNVAKSYNVTVGDYMSVEFENATKALKIVGFFGPEPSSQFGVYAYWSYIPLNLYAYPGNLTSASAKILVKLNTGADGIAISQNVQSVDTNISYVDSVAEELEKAQTNAITTGALEVQELGVIFAVLAASVGTALISVVSIRERGREATIMSVRGLSYKQLVIMFLTENMALVTFAVASGVFVGLISVYGNVSSSNAQTAVSLVTRHFIFPLESTLVVIGCVALIFAATVLPVIIMSRKYVTKLERMVRSR